MQHRFLL